VAALSLLLVLMLAAASSSVAAASIVNASSVFGFRIVSIPVAGVKAGVGREQRTLYFGDYVALEHSQPPIKYRRKDELEKAIGPAASSSVSSPSIQAVSKEWLAAQCPGEC
jgi:hypothetical protein